MAGYWPSPTGRYTSARSTMPSSIAMGASQSICMLSRISLLFGFMYASSRLRPMTFDRVGIGRIRTHVNSALPCAFERIGNLQRHLTNVLDFNLDGLAVLQRAKALVVGAAGDQVAGIHGHDRGCKFDQLRNTVLHVVGIVVVAQLAVVCLLYTSPSPRDGLLSRM